MRWLADFRGYLIYDSWVSTSKRCEEQRYSKIVLSWGISTDIDDSGVYRDRYFDTTSIESPDTLWIVMYSGYEKPKLLDKNVILLYRPKLAFLKSVLKLFNTVVDSIKNQPFLNKINYEISSIVVQELLNDKAIVKVIVPYEAQPFQQTLFERLKVEFPKVMGIGYLHSAPPPLPTDLIFRKGCPSKLLVHGEGIKEMLCEQLGWPLSTITVINSIRYNRVSLKNFSSKVLLPYSFEDLDRILEAFNIVVERSLLYNIRTWKVRNHPVQDVSPDHLKLQKSIEQIINNGDINNVNTYSVKNRTVMIGATAAILEALEYGLEVIHIASNPIFEAHSLSIWKYLDVERLGDYVFLYRMKEAGKYIKIDEQEVGFSAVFDI
jgi:hypothetical protein